MRDETKVMAFVVFIEGILGLFQIYDTVNFDFVLGDYATIFSTYPMLGVLTFLITLITFALVILEEKVGYGMLVALILFGLFAIPLGTIISIIFLIWILAEYEKFRTECL